MNKSKNILQYIIAYVAWISSFLLWALFIVMGREVLLAVVRTYYVKTSFLRGLQVSLIDRSFFLITGLIWLVMMVVVENYFRVGVRKNQLARRIGRVFAPILALIFLTHLGRSLLIGLGAASASTWLSLVLELAAVVVFAWLGFRKIPAPGRQIDASPVK